MNVKLQFKTRTQINSLLAQFIKPLSVWSVLAILVSACTSTTGPVVVRDVSSAPKVNEAAKNNSELEQDINPKEKKIASTIPVYQSQSVTVIPLVEKLIVQSSEALDKKQYEEAINLAERGLRINRKEPRLYLLLSKSYKNMQNRKQSVFFAKQGLQYTQAQNPVFVELNSLSQ